MGANAKTPPRSRLIIKLTAPLQKLQLPSEMMVERLSNMLSKPIEFHQVSQSYYIQHAKHGAVLE